MPQGKRFLVFLIVAAVVSALISQLTNTLVITGSIEKISWRSFTDSKGLFTIQYPSKWEAMNATDPLGPIDVEFWYYGDTTSTLPDTYAMVNVAVSPNSEYVNTQEMIKNDQFTMESSGINFRLEQGTECDNYVINQLQGCSHIYLLSFPELKYERKALLVDAVDNSTGIQYSMGLIGSEDVFEQLKPVFDHMVNSFKLNSNAFVE